MKRQVLKRGVLIGTLVVLTISPLRAQMVASHTATEVAQQPASRVEAAPRPVARVNGAVLTDRDLLREMYAIFPYARQHNGGFPKDMEAGIRSGAMKMMIFEELVYQDALRRKMTVPPAKMQKAVADFHKQFSTPDQYQEFVQSEFNGSPKALRDKIRRSLLIDALLKVEVERKAAPSLAEAKDYYDKNPARFEYPESFAIQTISILPPAKATAEQLKEGRKRAEDALRQAKITKSYEEFGVLAEKISDDDYRVMMGDHKFVDRAKLAPQVVQALLTMQPEQVSDIIAVDQAYTIVRLNKHVLAGKTNFADVKSQIQKELETKKTNQLRAALDKELRRKAKVEEL